LNNLQAWFKGLSGFSKAVIITTGAVVSLGAASAMSAPETSPPAAPPVAKPAPPTITTKTETKKEAIAYTQINQDDASVESGTSFIKTPGRNGEKTITDTITLTDGKETGRKSTEAITSEPITQVTIHGTKPKPKSVCDPNYYGCD
jgi:hypothetical protein